MVLDVQLNDLQTYLVHEFVADYRDGLLSRRDLVARVLHITGSAAATASLLTSLGVPGAAAQDAAPPAASSPAAGASRSPLSVPPDDPAVENRDITFPNQGATIMAYQSRPSGQAGPRPLVLICHENRGLTDHIRDVARRFAKAGYVGCAVDLLSREGGTAHVADPAQIPALLTNVDPMRHVGDFQAAAAYYRTRPFVNADQMAMTGYCFGGGIAWRAVEAMPELKAAAPYYGPPPPLDAVKNIKAAVLGVYSSDPNDFANKGRDELAAALKAAGVTHEIEVYPNTQHAFNNDTGPRYNEPAALAAWRDTLAWFARHVRGA
jgi:carboxymethylenebutenolidase